MFFHHGAAVPSSPFLKDSSARASSGRAVNRFTEARQFRFSTATSVNKTELTVQWYRTEIKGRAYTVRSVNRAEAPVAAPHGHARTEDQVVISLI